MKNISNKKLSFLIALLYVGLGTIYSYSYWHPDSSIVTNETLGNILYYFFLPVSFFPILIIFTEREPFLYILISQTIALLLLWPCFYLLTNLFRKESKYSDDTLKNFLDGKDK